MPRYYCLPERGAIATYCWADSPEQAKRGMDSYFVLTEQGLCRGVHKSINQRVKVKLWPELDFRTQPEPLPKEVTTDD